MRERERLPVYLTAGDMVLQGYLDHIEGGRSFGVNAYKLHSYKGGKADIPLLTDVRKAVGDDYDLINDPVCSYDLREAIEVGRAMEELDYIWLEEPMHEQKMSLYQELCRTLTIPVMATERLMHDADLTAQWLIQGATDRLRARATFGLTQALKLAHFAELHAARMWSSTARAASSAWCMRMWAAASTTPTITNFSARPIPGACAPKERSGGCLTPR